MNNIPKKRKGVISSFSGIFGEMMGITFSKFALRYRIKEAARQLLLSGDSIKTIALDWGFADISHFHNSFRSHFSVSPGEYRKLYGKGQG